MCNNRTIICNRNIVLRVVFFKDATAQGGRIYFALPRSLFCGSVRAQAASILGLSAAASILAQCGCIDSGIMRAATIQLLCVFILGQNAASIGFWQGHKCRCVNSE